MPYHDNGLCMCTHAHTHRYVNEAQFKIQILRQRRDRHEELAKQKFKDMIERLQNDPRLSILNN